MDTSAGGVQSWSHPGHVGNATQNYCRSTSFSPLGVNILPNPNRFALIDEESGDDSAGSDFSSFSPKYLIHKILGIFDNQDTLIGK